MGRIRYTSDLHFNHPFIARTRGFTRLDINDNAVGDAEEHDGTVIQNFNQGTRDDDLTIIAGDFAMNWRGVEVQLSALRGRKILVAGNHDIMSAVHRDGWKHRAAWTGPDMFDAIMDFMRRKAAGREFLISHYPYMGEGDRAIPERYTQYRLRDQGMWLVHGHTHSKEKLTPLPAISCFTCGLDMTKETCEDMHKGTDLEGQGCARWVSRQIHVGLDAWDLRPVHEETVLEMMRDGTEKI